MAGTTRDAVDSPFENQYGRYLFIDTAGIRRKSRVDDRIEKFSVLRAQMAIERADVCLILIDAPGGRHRAGHQDRRYGPRGGQGSVVVVNKWDLVEKDGKTMDRMRKDVLRGPEFHVLCPGYCLFPP